MYVPPNGFIGAGSQTQAAQLIELGMPRNGNGNGNGTRRRKRKAKAAPAKRAKRAPAKRAKRANGKRMVKGSAAAKRYMASIRRKRKR